MQPREQHVPHRLLGAIVIGAHQAVADRVDARPGIPVRDEPPNLRAPRVIAHSLAKGPGLNPFGDEALAVLAAEPAMAGILDREVWT